VALASRFVRFKRFHFAKPFFFVLIFYFDILDIKKETLRSQLAWQRSTLAERKFATIDAMDLT
ncbi:hypothetical protein, partial [Staphylococcus argenteus]|uniref:hypothetical protein n=1 Tax=Staphylococcus argenteus TaxID=985002 RepID=UPI001C4B89B4